MEWSQWSRVGEVKLVDSATEMCGPVMVGRKNLKSDMVNTQEREKKNSVWEDELGWKEVIVTESCTEI